MQGFGESRFGRHTLILGCGYALWLLSMFMPSGLGSGIRGLGLWTVPMLFSFGVSSLTDGSLAGALRGAVLLLGLACNVLIFLRLPRWLAWLVLVLPLLPFILLVLALGARSLQFYCFYPWIAGIWLVQLAKLAHGAQPRSPLRRILGS